jgi:hypothetical protein
VPTPSSVGALEGARRWEWRSGGSAHRRAANTGHGEAREWVRERRESQANEMRAREKEEGERKVGSTEQLSPVNSAGTPTSHYRG